MGRASRGKEVEAEVVVGIKGRGGGEAGTREAEGGTGHQGEGTGAGSVIRATTHLMVTVSTHPEEGGGVAEGISHPGEGGESTHQEEGEVVMILQEVVEVVILQPQLGRVKVTSAPKCCKTPGRIFRTRWVGGRVGLREIS